MKADGPRVRFDGEVLGALAQSAGSLDREGPGKAFGVGLEFRDTIVYSNRCSYRRRGDPIDGHVRRRQPGLALGVRGVVDRKTHSHLAVGQSRQPQQAGDLSRELGGVDASESQGRFDWPIAPHRYRCRGGNPPAVALDLASSHDHGLAPGLPLDRDIADQNSTRNGVVDLRPAPAFDAPGIQCPTRLGVRPTVPDTLPPPVLKVVSAKSWASGRLDASSRETNA